ncbi:hypothetical protein LJK88_17335 [Paenibacillus sp. P26]|nr:hypothetical protein LJK88_17335 [Paenibacillus sp. P26]
MYEKLEASGIAHFDVKSQSPRWVYESAMRAAKKGEEARSAIRDAEGLRRRQRRRSAMGSSGALEECLLRTLR